MEIQNGKGTVKPLPYRQKPLEGWVIEEGERSYGKLRVGIIMHPEKGED